MIVYIRSCNFPSIPKKNVKNERINTCRLFKYNQLDYVGLGHCPCEVE